jgi:hypothetical protein
MVGRHNPTGNSSSNHLPNLSRRHRSYAGAGQAPAEQADPSFRRLYLTWSGQCEGKLLLSGDLAMNGELVRREGRLSEILQSAATRAIVLGKRLDGTRLDPKKMPPLSSQIQVLARYELWLCHSCFNLGMCRENGDLGERTSAIFLLCPGSRELVCFTVRTNFIISCCATLNPPSKENLI